MKRVCLGPPSLDETSDEWPSCESAHIPRGIASNHCCASELILPIIVICILNLRCVVAKAALCTKFFKSLSLKQIIKLLDACKSYDRQIMEPNKVEDRSLLP